MKKLPFLALALAVVLSGCGDPAPSTPVAADQPPLPDLSTMSKDDVDKSHQEASGIGEGRQGGGGVSNPADKGATPADRGG